MDWETKGTHFAYIAISGETQALTSDQWIRSKVSVGGCIVCEDGTVAVG